ncbi:MAG: long-chain-fatty-acid--[acyl-carrier-protein] ligase, partial [Pseudomonadota bacterium]
MNVSLIGKRRFAPLFVTQFLGAFNDNLFKTAALLLASYSLFRDAPEQAEQMGVIATALFTLPYFILSAPAGQLADAMDKARLARWVKLGEVALMAIGLAGFALHSVGLMLTTICLLGVHSTVFGPVKYAILPQHLGRDEVMQGTGLVEAGTFVAILAGQLLAAQLSMPWGIGLTALSVAVAGYAAAWMIPPAPPPAGAAPVDANIVRSSIGIVRAAHANPSVWRATLGISWFFAIGAVITTIFIPLVKAVLLARAEVASLFLFTFSVAIALGALMVNRLLKGEVSARFTPVSSLVLALGLIDLWRAISGFVPVMTNADIAGFIAGAGSIRILVDLVIVAAAGGVFVVPLYAVLQTRSPEAQRSQMIAANNIVNAVVTVVLSIIVAALLKGGMSIAAVIGMLGFATLAVALIATWLLPETLIKAAIRGLFGLLYKVRLKGAENMPAPGEAAVIVVNHVSFLDGLLLAVFLPGKPTFAVNTQIAKAWWVKPALRLFDAFPVDPTNPMSTKAMVKAVREGRTLVIFPEGRITVTGALMKVFDGPGMIADKADAPIIPVRIDGAQFTRFSRLGGKIRRRWFPEITLTILPPRHVVIEGDHSARQRRAIAGRQLYDVMSEMIFATSDIDRTLFQALLDAREVHGKNPAILEDTKRQPISYQTLLTGAVALGKLFARETSQGEAVGLLLPNVNAVIVSFFGLQLHGRVPAMLNYTAGLANLEAACRAAEIKTIITARAFVEQAKLGDTLTALEAKGLRLVWLEDLGASISIWGKIAAVLKRKVARQSHSRLKINADAPAVILFTSGSEGLPKGVVLTHRNLLANIAQIGARVDFNASDIVLNALPVFHSFGLTGGTLLPLLNGVKVFLYPSPLHYRIVPALAYDCNATILFGTDTFLAGYARMAHNYDFYSVRYIFAGAERVRDETRKSYSEKFGLRILEGYGATEAGPVIAVNTPMHFRPGTVGRLLPAVTAKLDAVPGIAEGGRLSIKGPNIMAGYYKADAPGVVQPPEGGWHDTGDIVVIDDEGYVSIRGRAKRFAKLGGEMI